MSDAIPASGPHARLQVDYSDETLDALLAAPDTLAVFGFGHAAPRADDPRYLRVALEPHGGAAPLEVWRGGAPVARGREHGIAWAEDGALQFGALQLDEADGDGIDGIGEAAYRRLLAFTAARGYPHLLRIWNYFDAITDGDGDAERYKRFCVGRARGLGDVPAGTLPAATAIGRPTDTPARDSADASQAGSLQVYWLASRTPGTPLENPRQLSAYRYPRVYGPQPPSFARALLPPEPMPLLLSGTAAIVGHESRHADCVATQVDETLANFDSLIAAARLQRPSLPARFGPGTRLKVYVRDHDELAAVAALLDARLGADVPRIVLHANVCRRELRVEIDGSHA
ncbi:pteridine-dependent deoxygenase [Lysobacter koreensis]|uniref:Pteridine-dependent deoxygenase n=1 Tax=Lysobacter koreensis TaxID=266122 RepID=A0ABW2YLJ1_9GAMM